VITHDARLDCKDTSPGLWASEARPRDQPGLHIGTHRPDDIGALLSSGSGCTTASSAPPQMASGGLPDWKVRRLEAFISNNLAARISMQDLADLCAISLSHFQRVFTRHYGLSPHRYVTKVRLERAIEMLADTSLPIKFIALECGMADQAHLTKAIRREWETTPNRLRQRLEREDQTRFERSAKPPSPAEHSSLKEKEVA